MVLTTAWRRWRFERQLTAARARLAAGEAAAARARAASLAASSTDDPRPGRLLSEAYAAEGRHREAFEAACAVLNSCPGDRETRRLAARLAERIGAFDRAADLYRQSLDQDEDSDDRRGLLACLVAAGRHLEAERHWRSCTGASDDPRLLVLAVRLFLALGKPAEAVEAAGRIDRLVPESPTAWEARTRLAAAAGDMPAAVAAAAEGLAEAPDNPDLLELTASLAHSQGRVNHALAVWQRLSILFPTMARYHWSLADAALAQDQPELAEEHYQRAAALDPSHPAPQLGLAALCQAGGDMAGARRHLLAAATEGADYPDRLHAIGIRALALEEHALAEQVLAAAAERYPDCAEILGNLGVALIRRGRATEAATALLRATELEPTNLDTWANLGIALQDGGDSTAATVAYGRALTIDPGHTEARWGRAIARLLDGDFAGGWEDYGYRFLQVPQELRCYAATPWHGESLAGRSILVYGEQGLGDQIMFASCLPDLMARAARVVVDPDPRLAELFAGAFAAAEILRPGIQLSAPIDYYVPIGDLPGYFRRCWQDFPGDSYFVAAREKRVHWRQRLAALGPGHRIGISWRGGAARTRREIRSFDLETLLPLLKLPGCQFISLQYGPCREEVEALSRSSGMTLHHWPEAINDYAETAALVLELDLVVTVCTSLAHLAGALGQTAWVLVPQVPEWRYLRRGSRMPWYRSVELLRQETLGDWEPLIAAVVDRLKTTTAAEAAAATRGKPV